MGYGFDGGSMKGILLDDERGRAAFPSAAHTYADTAATGWGMGFRGGGGQGRGDWWSWDIQRGGMLAGPLDLSSQPGRAPMGIRIDLCGGAGGGGEGAPCANFPRAGARGCWEAFAGGWREGWLGRRRRRQTVEEGRDVSGKSWAGRVVAI